jgi:uncharacterized protein YjeT (DUF2065 family)
VLSIVIAVVWIVAGIYAIYQPRRHREYVRKLPNTAGNRQVKRMGMNFTVMGIVMVIVGAIWLLQSFLRMR